MSSNRTLSIFQKGFTAFFGLALGTGMALTITAPILFHWTNNSPLTWVILAIQLVAIILMISVYRYAPSRGVQNTIRFALAGAALVAIMNIISGFISSILVV
jgi:phosphatidylserine synthase